MLFQYLSGFEPILYTTHTNEEPVFAVFCDKMADEYSEKLKVRFWCNTRMVLQIVNLTGRKKEWKKYLRMVKISHYWQFSALLDGHWRIPL